MISAWIYCTFLLLTQFTAKANNAIGTLDFELKYEKMEGMFPSKGICDTYWGNLHCNLSFHICISDDNYYFSSCNVYQEETKVEWNTIFFKHRFSVDYGTNNELEIKIGVMAQDIYHRSHPSINHIFYMMPSNLSGIKDLNEIQLESSKEFSKITITVKRTCKPQHYGNECKFCSLSPEQGYCDADGNPICHPGKSCELDSDPCSDQECPPGEVCVRTGEKGEGARCEALGGAEEQFSDDACALEEARLGHPPCENGGHCVSTKNGTLFSCLCYNGWHGNRCEVSISQSITLGITVTAIVLVLVIAVLCCCQYFVLPKHVVDSKKGLAMPSLRVDTNRDEGCKENNLYVGESKPSLPLRSPSSQKGCSTTTDQHARHLLPPVTYSSEYNSGLYEEVSFRPIWETEYEPVSPRVQPQQYTTGDSQRPLTSDGYDTLPSKAGTQVAVKPRAEAEGEDYEYFC